MHAYGTNTPTAFTFSISHEPCIALASMLSLTEHNTAGRLAQSAFADTKAAEGAQDDVFTESMSATASLGFAHVGIH